MDRHCCYLYKLRCAPTFSPNPTTYEFESENRCPPFFPRLPARYVNGGKKAEKKVARVFMLR